VLSAAALSVQKRLRHNAQGDAFKAVAVLAAAPDASARVDQIASTLKELNRAFGDNF
jgi:hypothetical protein